MKATKREDLTIEIDGIRHKGSRVIEGTRKLFQTIHFGPASRFDPHAYTPTENTHMQGVATLILRELVKESQNK